MIHLIILQFIVCVQHHSKKLIKTLHVCTCCQHSKIHVHVPIQTLNLTVTDNKMATPNIMI